MPDGRSSAVPLPDGEAVLTAARARAAALAEPDEPALRRLLHPAFAWTSHTGARFDLETYVAANVRGPRHWSGQELRDPTVRVVGDTAVLCCVAVDTVDGATFVMPMTQTWVRSDSGWQCLAGHAGPRLSERA